MVNRLQDHSPAKAQEIGSRIEFSLLAMMTAKLVPEGGSSALNTSAVGRDERPLSCEIAAFYAPAAMEPTLLRWLQRIYGSQSAFTCRAEKQVAGTHHRLSPAGAFRALTRPLQAVDDLIRASGCPPLVVMNPDASRLPPGMAGICTEFRMGQLRLQSRKHPGEAWRTLQVYDLLPGNGL